MSTVKIGKVKGLAAADAQGQPTLLGVGTPKNATSGKARLLQVQIGPKLQAVQFVPQAGEDVNPPDGSLVIIQESAEGIKFGVATFDGIGPDPNLNQGEKRLYGSDGNGTVLGRVKFKKNGKTFIGNAGGNLCAQLDALLTALNTFSGTAAQNAITAGNTTSVTLAAAIVALLAPLFTAVVNAKTAIDAILDTTE